MSYGGGSGGSGSIHASTDVALNNPSDGQVLGYNGGLAKWQNQTTMTQAVLETLVVSGPAAVGNNVLPPGSRVSRALTITEAHIWAGTAPTGSALTITVNRSGTTLVTLPLAAGQATADQTGLSISLSAGDILTYNITAIGSSGPGSDVAVQLVGN